jgi:hypothetical protein
MHLLRKGVAYAYDLLLKTGCTWFAMSCFVVWHDMYLCVLRKGVTLLPQNVSSIQYTFIVYVVTYTKRIIYVRIMMITVWEYSCIAGMYPTCTTMVHLSVEMGKRSPNITTCTWHIPIRTRYVLTHVYTCTRYIFPAVTHMVNKQHQIIQTSNSSNTTLPTRVHSIPCVT